MGPGTCSELTLGIVGSGGDGVVLLGELLARSAADSGVHCFMEKVFGPQIRGGESSISLRIADRPVLRSGDMLDVLLVFQWSDLARFADMLHVSPAAIVICPEEDTDDPFTHGLPAEFHGQLLRLPLKQLALDEGRSKQSRNMVLLGALASLLDWYPAALQAGLERRMLHYDERSRDNNIRAYAAGKIAAADWDMGGRFKLPTAGGQGRPPSQSGLRLATGNELLCEAALAAGCRFMAGYPITPASEILAYMNRHLPALGGSCVQAEDEMAAACLSIGAALGGVRSMSATSGPGMTLKSESIALAGMAGLPMVVVDVQRCGPSTGIPTRTEQADLNLALYGAHGDSPRIVLAAAHLQDCAELAAAAFELAEDCRVPVILLSEQQIAQGLASVPLQSLAAQLPEPAGWPTVAIGSATQVQLTGLEHDDEGRPRSDAACHSSKSQLRQGRVDAALGRVPPLQYGPDRAELGLLCWGSGYAACCEAADVVNKAGSSASVHCLRMLAPLDTAGIEAWLSRQRRIIVVEMNHSGQLLHHLRSQLTLPQDSLSLRRSGGWPWQLRELTQFLSDNGLLEELPA